MRSTFLYKKSLLSFSGLMLLSPTFAAETAIDNKLEVGEVITSTLKNSPQIRNQKLGVEKAKGQARSATGAFDIVTNVSLNRSRNTPTLVDPGGFHPSEVAVYNSLPPAVKSQLLLSRETDNTNLTGSLTKPFRTGISTTLSATTLQNDFEPVTGMPNPFSKVIDRTTVMFTVNIPFLKGSGREGSAAAVERNAELLYQATLANYQHTISQVIRDTLVAYWNYVGSNWYLKRINESVAKISEVISRVPRRSDTLQSYLEERKGKIIDAQNEVDQTRVALAQVMGISANELQSLGYPAPNFPLSWGDKLAHFDRAAVESKMMQDAEQNRLDYRATKLQLEAAETLLNKAKKDILPTLNLSLGAGYNGFTQYDGFNQFFKSYKANTNKFDYNVGLVFNYPIGNNVAEGALDSNTAAYQQALVNNQDALRGIKLNVKGDLSNIYNQMQKSVQIEKTINSYIASLKEIDANPAILTDQSKQAIAMNLQDKFLAALKDRVDALTGLAAAIAKARFTTGNLVKIDDASGMVNMADLQIPPGL